MIYSLIKEIDKEVLNNQEIAAMYKRDAFKEIISMLDQNWRGIIVSGLRQIGKTTILKQLRMEYKSDSVFITIDNLITDNGIKDLKDNIISMYFKEGIKLFLIDEIQNIKEWGYFITDLSNMLADAKFVISGSASLHAKNSKGSARFTTYDLLPLSLHEYKEYKKIGEGAPTEQVFKESVGYKSIFAYTDINNLEINKLTNEYLNSYVFSDIKRYHKDIKTSDLKKILDFMKHNTSGEVIKQDLMDQGIGSDYKTLKSKYAYLDKHINILEDYHLIKILRRFSFDGGIGRSYKIYLNPHLYLMLIGIDPLYEEIPDGNKGYFFESYLYFYKLLGNNIKGYIKQKSNAKIFAKHEIDFFSNKKWIEVKASESISHIKKSLSKMFVEGNKKDIEKEIISLSTIPEILGITNTNFFSLIDKKE